MAHVTEAELEAAEIRGRILLGSEPRAIGVRYDSARKRVVLELTNGCAYAFPAAMAQELSTADADALSDVEVDGGGFNVHWPRLDVDLHVPSLIAGVFGTEAWMRRGAAATAA